MLSRKEYVYHLTPSEYSPMFIAFRNARSCAIVTLLRWYPLAIVWSGLNFANLRTACSVIVQAVYLAHVFLVEGDVDIID